MHPEHKQLLIIFLEPLIQKDISVKMLPAHVYEGVGIGCINIHGLVF